jgi:hypothetical protein
MTFRIELYDSTGDYVGCAVRDDDSWLLYNKHGKLVAKVPKTTTGDDAVRLILGSLWYLC